jgi:hypothetical protein
MIVIGCGCAEVGIGVRAHTHTFSRVIFVMHGNSVCVLSSSQTGIVGRRDEDANGIGVGVAPLTNGTLLPAGVTGARVVVGVAAMSRSSKLAGRTCGQPSSSAIT